MVHRLGFQALVMLIARQHHASVRGADEAVRPASDLAVGTCVSSNDDGTIIINTVAADAAVVSSVLLRLVLFLSGALGFVTAVLHGTVVGVVRIVCGRSIDDVAEIAKLCICGYVWF